MKRKPSKNPTPNPLLKIGDSVTVKAVVDVVRTKDWDESTADYKGPLRRVMERTDIEPTRMLVVGARRRYLGVVHVGHHHSFDGDEYDSGYLDVHETVFVYQARESLMRKIVEVLPQDVCFDS